MKVKFLLTNLHTVVSRGSGTHIRQQRHIGAEASWQTDDLFLVDTPHTNEKRKLYMVNHNFPG